jgi:predicted AlkP superfamily phosphohydrolase/phosphomutase
MRVLILGIDALEYNLVEEWDLKNLKQVEYGKTIVPVYKTVGEPVTLVVWPCFITGKEPEEMGFDSPILYRQPLKWAIENIYYPLTSGEDSAEENEEKTIMYKKATREKLVSRLNYLSMRAGFGRYPTRKDIKASTMFDDEDIKSYHFHVPVYDETHTIEEHGDTRNNVIAALADKSKRKEFDQKLSQEFKDKSKQVFEILEDDAWDLSMHYFYVLDGVQHVFFKNKLKIMDYYLKFNNFVGKLKEQLPEDTILLIISDHGQENGLHTNYGFYSSNVKLGLDNPKITDFKEIITKMNKD